MSNSCLGVGDGTFGILLVALGLGGIKSMLATGLLLKHVRARTLAPHDSVRHRGDEHDQEKVDEQRRRCANRCRSVLFVDSVRNPYHSRIIHFVGLIATEPSFNAVFWKR